MLPRQNVSGKVLVQQVSLNQQLDHAAPENLGHRLEPGKGDENESSLIIEATLQPNGS